MATDAESIAGTRTRRLNAVDESVMNEVVARLKEAESTFDWVGVYVLRDGVLHLGPFRGEPTEHDRIPIGEGVCGSVAAKAETEVVPDVRKRPGHIACSLSSRSEVVVPIVRDGAIFGVLDVDSNALDAFGQREVQLVENAAREIATRA
jgi:putative methionine-R-sulfoxide reductase with GAF domain